MEDGAVIGSLENYSLGELIAKKLETSYKLQLHRMERIDNGQLGEGFNNCTFCNSYFLETDELINLS